MQATIRRDLGLSIVGLARDVRERFYAISLEAKLKNPAVIAVCETARKALAT